MKIGIISDTHDNVFGIKEAVAIFKKEKVEFVCHCGDVVAPVTAALFSGLSPRFVRGNCDGDVENLKARAEYIDGTYYGELGEFELKGKKFAMTHYPEIAEKLVKGKKYDYVLHGHTHRIRDQKIGKTRILNPGNLYLSHQDHGIMILDVEKDIVNPIKLG